MRSLPASTWPAFRSRPLGFAFSLFAFMGLMQCLWADEPTNPTAPSSEAIDFFETRIRPVLVEHCYSCHSEKALVEGELQADLFVDNASGLLSGGSSGPGVVPGDPDASLILSAMRYEDFEMPPQGKLDDQILQDFEQWIRSGAADQRGDTNSTRPKNEIDFKAARQHWAYQPLSAPPIPKASLQGAYHADSAIDAFILSTAAAISDAATDSLSPAPQADRRTLVRRLYYDLIGLPPTPEQIQQFTADARPDAIERLIDQLLASPQFGERWARHWLDVVRYAESVTLRGLVQHEAWRYRDYTISSFNSDLPYNDFLIQQIAGDLLPAESIQQACQQHIATTFLTLGNNNLEDQDKEKLRMDAVDEQLSVIGSALLAQTIGCARCHDHKFDPIPTSDYYALAGILRNSKTLLDANVSNWIEQPLPATDEDQTTIAEFKAQVEQLTIKISAAESELGLVKAKSGKSVPKQSLPGIVLDNDQAMLTGNWEPSNHSPRFVGNGYMHDSGSERGSKVATFNFKVLESGRYEVRVSYAAGANRSTKVSIAVQDYIDVHHKTINQRQPPAIDGLFASLGIYQFDVSTPGMLTISNAGADGHVIVDAVQLLPTTASTLTSSAIDRSSADTLVATSASESDKTLDRATLQKQLEAWRSELKELNASAPAQPKYMAIIEDPEKGDIPIHIRGNVHQHGKVVPRGFLTIADIDRELSISADESGRLQLGQWLSDPSNPLPARVFANRVWLWLFGAGLCRTPDNFGTTGLEPTHPQLLDYLAQRLIDSGWSVKTLVREIVLSDAYQRASFATPDLQANDPENQFWLRQNRKRIEAECLVDAMLLSAGQLDLAFGGKTLPEKLSADYGFQTEMNRRALYWPALRNSISDLIKVFDGADPSLVTGKRNNSTVAPQALLMLNHPWVIEQSRTAGKALSQKQEQSLEQKVHWVFETTLGRTPSVEEQISAIAFVSSVPEEEQSRQWGRLIQSLWATIDFRYLY